LGAFPTPLPNLTVEVFMSRQIRALAALLLVSFALSAAACADATAPTPSADLVCDHSNPNICR